MTFIQHPASADYYAVAVTTQTICEVVVSITFNLSHWIFALKYLVSALTLPALFGGAKMSETARNRLALADKVMWWIVIVVPTLGYSGIWSFRCIYQSTDSSIFSVNVWVPLYIAFIAVMSLSQLLTALILLFAILSIRTTLKYNNKLKTFNLSMFMVNAVAFLL